MGFWGVEVQPEKSLKVTPGEHKLIHISQATLVCTEKIRESVILTVTVDKTNLVIGILSQEDFPQISFNLVFEKEFELSHNCSKGSVHFIGHKSPNIHHYSAVAVTDSGSAEPAATIVVNSDPKPDVKLKMGKVIGEALGEGIVCIKSGSEEKKLKLSDTLIESFRDVKCASEEGKRYLSDAIIEAIRKSTGCIKNGSEEEQLSDAIIEAIRKSTGCIKNGSEEEQLSDTLTEALGDIKCGSEEKKLKLSDTLIEALRNIKCGSEEEKLKLSDTLVDTLWNSNIRYDFEYEKKKVSDFLAKHGCKELKPSPSLRKALKEFATRIARDQEEYRRCPLVEELVEDRIKRLGKAVKEGLIVPI